jgi:hypothetical protein
VLAAFVGLVVFVTTSPMQDQAVVSSPTSTPLKDPSTTTSTTATTTTTATTPTTTDPATTTTTTQPAGSSTLPALPQTGGDGPDWLWSYYPVPDVLSGQVVDVDGDGEPDVALFGSAESPMIYTIADGGDPIEPSASAQELVAARERIAELESDVGALELSTRELTEQLAADDSAPAPQSATPTATARALDGEVDSTTTLKDPDDGVESSGLTSTQQSLLLALISTAGVVLVGLGAPLMTAWARRRFGEPSEE